MMMCRLKALECVMPRLLECRVCGVTFEDEKVDEKVGEGAVPVWVRGWEERGGPGDACLVEVVMELRIR